MSLRNSGNPFVRSQALKGLSELSWEKFKLVLFNALYDTDRNVRLDALGIALDYVKDPAVKTMLDAMKADPDPLIRDWLKRASKKRLCDP